jgi:hypothetical protein
MAPNPVAVASTTPAGSSAPVRTAGSFYLSNNQRLHMITTTAKKIMPVREMKDFRDKMLFQLHLPHGFNHRNFHHFQNDPRFLQKLKYFASINSAAILQMTVSKIKDKRQV